ncbi:hypothetical protein [Kribbella sp. CA-293567]|uniref:hypothetical protein n=1 Tax=Kribbella sp. CA-293567 TaxID=3002436 RepID=UPI0022DDD8BD|nr:hypothetical protein [Kribbella sp. CA-293567]WBQ03035.1 hypothetical protein OX958_23995 [Kribbella sp. CA-293567]
MVDYYKAASLEAFGEEMDRRWPNRANDGWIGDPSHQARKSDHNPDWDAGGVVRAIDVYIKGIDKAAVIAAALRDPRTAYIIHDRKIASATDDGQPWDWEPYDGDPHEKHIHISIKHTRAAETNTAAWFKKAAPAEEDEVKEADIEAIATRVYRKLEPRLQAYTQDLKTFERQTDGPDALRAGQAAEAEILTTANIDRIATAVAAKITAAATPKA